MRDDVTADGASARDLGPDFFRPVYGARVPFPAGWTDASWYEFRDPADGTTYALLESPLAPAQVDAWLEKKRQALPDQPPVVVYEHPIFLAKGLSIAPSPAIAIHTVLLVPPPPGPGAVPSPVLQLMITGPRSQADVQAFLRGVVLAQPGYPAGGGARGWAALGLCLPLAARVTPPRAFERRGPGAVLTIAWTAEDALPMPDLQPFIEEEERLRHATDADYERTETSLVVERRLVAARVDLEGRAFVAQALLMPTRPPPPWRLAAPLLRLGLSAKLSPAGLSPAAIETIWTDILTYTGFFARSRHGG